MTVVTFDHKRCEIPCRSCEDTEALFRRIILALDRAGIEFETVKLVQILPWAFVQCEGKWALHKHN